MGMPAARAGLRGMAGVDTDHDAPLRLRFVGEKAPELGEAPGMQAATRLPATLLGAAEDANQVLHDDHGAGLDGVDDLPAQNVVAVAPEAVDLPGQLAEMPLGRAGAFALEAATKPEVPALDLLPTAFAHEVVVGADDRARKAHVHSHDLPRRVELHIGDGDDEMQPELTFAVDQVGAVVADGLIQQTLSVLTDGTRHNWLVGWDAFLPRLARPNAPLSASRARSFAAITSWAGSAGNCSRKG